MSVRAWLRAGLLLAALGTAPAAPAADVLIM